MSRSTVRLAVALLVIAGVVPQRVRRPVALQRRVDGHWRQVDRARTSRAGRYAFDLWARAATYRVVARSVRAGRERLPAWTSRRTTLSPLAQRGAVRCADPPADRHVGVAGRVPRPLNAGSSRAARRAPDVDTLGLDHPRPRATGRSRSGRFHDPSECHDDVPRGRRKPWVTGYYAAWFWDWLYPPAKVDMTAMTHFVFGRVAPGGGAPDGSGKSIEQYLIDKAHAAATKALLMLGGDGADGRGFMLSSDDVMRAEFVDNIVDYLVAHDHDGVDVDWENCLGDNDRDCGGLPQLRGRAVDRGQGEVRQGDRRRRHHPVDDQLRLAAAHPDQPADGRGEGELP
ncbi:hypothetical protein GCM10023350_19970 [Nocardioides endophyticus]|uniref:GH18 domain-containing protein n=1 Tax=Nocardioides endophyticus TaxID=1353775 RepID=A0ABP8YTM5_9ACTN